MTSMRLFGGALLLLVVPAMAQADGGYDPDHNCQYYVMHHLPVPVRCLAELSGNWSPHPYVDGEFAFRNREEFLRWRDREDYRHWKLHDFTWQPAAAQANPAAPPEAAVATPGPASTVLCPARVVVKIVPPPDGEGWSATPAEMTAKLDATNPPHASGAILTCTYALGAQRGAVMLSRPAPESECRASADGFDCPAPVN